MPLLSLIAAASLGVIFVNHKMSTKTAWITLGVSLVLLLVFSLSWMLPFWGLSRNMMNWTQPSNPVNTNGYNGMMNNYEDQMKNLDTEAVKKLLDSYKDIYNSTK